MEGAGVEPAAGGTGDDLLGSVALAIARPATADLADKPAWHAESGWLLPAPEQS